MMRRKNSVISFAIAIVVSVALSACGQKSDVGSNLGVRIIEGQAFARSGLPLAGLLVVVDGNQTTADANGRFRIEVTFPLAAINDIYDLVDFCFAPDDNVSEHPCEGAHIVDPDFSNVDVLAFQGIHTLNPVFVWERTSGNVMSLTGTADPLQIPLPGDHAVLTAVDHPMVYDTWISLSADTGEISGYARWGQTPLVTAELWSIHQIDQRLLDASSEQYAILPAQYVGVGHTTGFEFELSFCAPREFVIPLEAPATTVRQTGQVELAAGHVAVRRDYSVAFGAASMPVGMELVHDTPADPLSFSWLAPVLDGAVVKVCARSVAEENVAGAAAPYAVACATASAPDESLRVVVPATIDAHAAWDPGNGVWQFNWSTAPEGEYLSKVKGDIQLGETTVPFIVYGQGARIALPSLGAIGVEVTAATQLAWEVGLTNKKTLEEVAGGGFAGSTAFPAQQRAGTTVWDIVYPERSEFIDP